MPLPQQQVSQQAQPDVSHAVSASTGAVGVGVGGNWSAGVVAASYTAPGEVGSWNPDVFGGAK